MPKEQWGTRTPPMIGRTCSGSWGWPAASPPPKPRRPRRQSARWMSRSWTCWRRSTTCGTTSTRPRRAPKPRRRSSPPSPPPASPPPPPPRRWRSPPTCRFGGSLGRRPPPPPPPAVAVAHARELAVVRDADRLDAMGAVGAARTFAFVGATGRPLVEGGAHFGDKLLRLVDCLGTAAGRELGRRRHALLERFAAALSEELAVGDEV